MKTLVYRYRLQPPVENEALVREQLSLAHAYRKTLTTISRGERAAVREAIAGAQAVQDATAVAMSAMADVIAASKAIRAEHSKSRAREHTETLQAQLYASRVVLQKSLAALDSARRAAKREVKSRVEEIEIMAHALRINAREHCGLYWGTYQLVEDAADRSLRKILSPGKSIALPLWDGTEPCDPHYPRWNGTGSISTQIMGGASVAEMENGSDTRAQIAVSSDARKVGPIAPDPTSKRSMKRRSCMLAIRVGSVVRAPIWARFPILMHRPLPPDCTIMRVTVKVDRIGPHEQWHAMFVIRTPEEHRVGTGTVAVDLGWRVIGDELRVAMWVDDNGEVGELRLPAKLLARFRKTSDLVEIRKRSFNTARDSLREALSVCIELPEWIVKRTKTLAQWESCGKLAALAIAWRASRFPGDETAFQALEAWRLQDKHLWTWEAAQRDSTLRMRREIYRLLALKLATTHDTLVLERFDLRRVAKRPSLDDSEKINESARGNRQIAAPSELKECLVHAFSRGGTVVYCDPVDTTHECWQCGCVDEYDAAESLSHSCSGCGAQWDQDENAARVLLARWERERSSGGESTGTIRVHKPVEAEGKWQRVKREKEMRDAENGTARKKAAKDK